ncbi:hypothetical protein D3C78_622990 [compost metagenome]
MAADVPAAIGIGVEQAQVVAVLVDGVLGEAVGAPAVAAGQAVGGTGAVVVALVVDVVVEAGSAHEQAEVVLPLEVGFGEKADAVGDQAAPVESVVAIVAVGVGHQLVVAALGTPGQAVGQGGVPVDAQVIVGLEGQGAGRAAQAASQHQHPQAHAGVQ